MVPPDTGLPVADVGLVAPIPHPRRNIICLGKNYRDHVEEAAALGGFTGGIPTAPVYFSKMIDRVRGSTESVPVHTGVTAMLDYEAELAVIIGRAGHDIDPGSVPEYIFGYSILNDITARDLQKSHDQWFKGKSWTVRAQWAPSLSPRTRSRIRLLWTSGAVSTVSCGRRLLRRTSSLASRRLSAISAEV